MSAVPGGSATALGGSVAGVWGIPNHVVPSGRSHMPAGSPPLGGYHVPPRFAQQLERMTLFSLPRDRDLRCIYDAIVHLAHEGVAEEGLCVRCWHRADRGDGDGSARDEQCGSGESARIGWVVDGHDVPLDLSQ